MISALKNLVAPKKEELCGFSGTGVVLMADSRAIAKLSERVSSAELVDSLNRVTTALIGAIEKKEGIVYMHIGGSLIAYWPPSMMPVAARSAIGAASDAVAACGASVAVGVAIAEFALANVGPATGKRPLLVGAAYQRAEAALRVSRAGIVTVDSQTLGVLPADIQARFVRNDGYAELR
jgi:class 3 adenylate cyclase